MFRRKTPKVRRDTPVLQPGDVIDISIKCIYVPAEGERKQVLKEMSARYKALGVTINGMYWLEAKDASMDIVNIIRKDTGDDLG